MKKNLFLTGEIGIGKSTALSLAIGDMAEVCGGFRTYFTPDKNAPDRSLCISAASGGTSRILVEFLDSEARNFHLEHFDSFAADLLIPRQDDRLIIMDEIGKFERDSLKFRDAVYGALDGGIPVLGVLRKGIGGWMGDITHREDTEVIEVTTVNRVNLPFVIRQKLSLDSSSETDSV